MRADLTLTEEDAMKVVQALRPVVEARLASLQQDPAPLQQCVRVVSVQTFPMNSLCRSLCRALILEAQHYQHPGPESDTSGPPRKLQL